MTPSASESVGRAESRSGYPGPLDVRAPIRLEPPAVGVDRQRKRSEDAMSEQGPLSPSDADLAQLLLAADVADPDGCRGTCRGSDEPDVHRVIREILAKLPDEASIRAIDLAAELRRR